MAPKTRGASVSGVGMKRKRTVRRPAREPTPASSSTSSSDDSPAPATTTNPQVDHLAGSVITTRRKFNFELFEREGLLVGSQLKEMRFEKICSLDCPTYPALVKEFYKNLTRGDNGLLKDVQVKDETWSSCATKGYAVKPVKGSALLLFNLHPDATADQSSLHGGCAVLEGEKWSATKWIHARTFNPRKPSSVPGEECTNEDDNCPHWAATGECQKNPVFMLGTPDYYGSCRKSCGVC